MYRRVVTAALLALVVAGVAACGSKSGEPDVAFTVPAKPGATLPGVSTSVTLASAAGKPCVAATDVPKAEGKPEVKVPEGPPPTTLVKTDLKEGTGKVVQLGDNIKVHYVGIACSTGKQFDSSWDKGQPVDFPLTEGGLIKGWTDGIPGMKVGGQRLLVIPADLAYGAQGRSPQIAPDEALVFVVDIVDDTGPAPSSTVPGASVPPSSAVATTAPAK
jgi:peptidylprolyl isomerase